MGLLIRPGYHAGFTNESPQDICAAKPLPSIERAFRLEMLAAQSGHFAPASPPQEDDTPDRFLILLDLQNVDDLLFREFRSLHGPSPFVGRTLVQTGENSQSQVTTHAKRRK